MKKIVIVGGGVAGLSAAIYGCKAGYEVEVYEKHSIVGGECTGWKRKGFVIDNCIHWLTGTAEGSGFYNIWREVGILGDEVEVLQPDAFYSIEIKGERVTLWRDKVRAKKEFLEIAPEDEKEINKFFKYVDLAEKMDVPMEVPFDLMEIKDIAKLTKIGMAASKVMREYGQLSIEELSNRFKNPLLKELFRNYMPLEYLSYALIYSYATITSGNGAIPKGGSIPMAMRMEETLKRLGGKVFTKKSVEKVLLSEKSKKEKINATGILLEDGSVVKGDYIILTCDTNYTFEKLIDKKYMDKKMETAYDNQKKYPLKSGFQIAFSIPKEFYKVKETLIFECNPIKIADKEYHRMGLRSYNYDDSFTVDKKTIMQTNFNQYPEDYDYWLHLYKTDKEAYQKEKERLAEEIKEKVICKYPELREVIEILDVWTPVTYNRYVNAYKGAYMSFFHTKGTKNIRLKGSIPGISNVFIGSQWFMTPGGLPCAAVGGKFAVQRIMKEEGRNIREL